MEKLISMWIPHHQFKTNDDYKPYILGERKFADDGKEFGRESLNDWIENNVNLYSKILKPRRNGTSFATISIISFHRVESP